MASTLTIALASAIPAVFVVALALFLWYYFHKRSSSLFNRGITPIADEEIESWKTEPNSEKESYREPSTSTNNSPRHHAHNSSVSSTQKPSVIVYQTPTASTYQSTVSDQSPRQLPSKKRSFDIPQTPVLARAPNARPGLTDEAIQGDDAFIPQLKRQPSRLSKSTAGTTTRVQHSRHRSAYTDVTRDRWYGQQTDFPSPSRQSSDCILPRRSTGQRGHDRMYSATVTRPRMSLDEASTAPGGLSPRPLHQSEIGRAIG
jgi:hypothetical protein